ncbi:MULTISPECIES: DNA polymerase III subunit delta [Prochlorococcus]|uniref:DNA polymerase III subunit delta n=1 Tax=Prochlorococcus TaxID=1218 RepID=UPI000533AEDE|nr:MULTISPECIES: DNA polymerase III subunit delta [Prochlorococcus]KGG13675.1 DNA polymerasee III [Prochlorococcus sp. MIT 0601]
MPIHLIWGDDYGSSDRAIEKLIKSIIDPTWISINLSRLDGQDLSQASKALEEVQTPPFGNGGRVVVLKHSPFCNGCSSELSFQFEATLQHIPNTTHLVLNNSNKPDKRLKTTKLIQGLIKSKQATEEKFLLPAFWDEAGMKVLVERTALAMNIDLEEEAIYALIEAIGADTTRLISELNKLSLLEKAKTKQINNTEERVLITKKSVHGLLQGLSTNSLEIGNYLLEGNFGEAVTRANSLIDSGEPALRIISTLTGQIRGWLWVHLLEKDNQQDISFIAKQAGLANPKRVYVIRKQIKNKSTDFLIDLLKKLLKIEILVKQGTNPKHAFADGLLISC